MIKAIIFDCFGVLARDGWLPFRKRHFGDDQEKHDQATLANRRANAGLITYDDFLVRIGELAGMTAEQARSEIEDNPADDELFGYIRDTLKPRYKIGLLSNASGNFLHDIFSSEQIGLFDEVVLSHDVGATKPDPIMYETAAARLGVLTDECIFIDDQEWHVEGAQRVGMKAFQFVDTDQTIARIEELLRA